MSFIEIDTELSTVILSFNSFRRYHKKIYVLDKQLLMYSLFLCFFFHVSLPMEAIKRKIIRNLRVLENQGLVTTKNNYQDIVNAVARVSVMLIVRWTFF